MNSPSFKNIECCICKGNTTPSISGSSYLKINGKEYKVYYHRSCFDEYSKTIVEETLRQMAEEESNK